MSNPDINVTDFNTYKSPISLETSPMEWMARQIQQEADAQTMQHIMECVHRIKVNIDEDELIRALKYDRDQYTQGFADGRKSAQVHAHWIPSGYPEYPYRCSKCLNLTKEQVERSYCGSCGARMDE